MFLTSSGLGGNHASVISYVFEGIAPAKKARFRFDVVRAEYEWGTYFKVAEAINLDR